MKDGVSAKKYVDLELLNKQVAELERTIELTDQEIERASVASAMLAELQTTQEGQEILIPLGSGVFATVAANALSTVKMAVGAGVLVERTPEDAKAGMQTQLQELQRQRQKSLEFHEQLIEKIIQTQHAIEADLAKNGK